MRRLHLLTLLPLVLALAPGCTSPSKGDDDVIEYLNMDKNTVIQGYQSAHISLPGNIDQTRKALDIIFKNYCKAEQPKSPF